jgi:flagellar basal-body rod modification protein FlgD
MAIDAAALNAAAQSGVTSSSISARMETSRSSLADSEETFLALMTAQLKNQDPLAPVDSNQFTQQIVQMTGVEQQLLTNDLLKALVGMNDAGLSSSVGLIGKEVTALADTGALTGGKATFDYNLPRAAGTLKLEVVNAAGQVVATLDPAKLAKGDHSVEWNGKNSAGVQQPDGGLYSLKVTAEDTGGSAIAATSNSTIKGVVTAVSYDGGQTVVTIGDRKILTTAIISVAQAATASNSNTPTTPTETPAAAA